jgi:hypothetical protein
MLANYQRIRKGYFNAKPVIVAKPEPPAPPPTPKPVLLFRVPGRVFDPLHWPDDMFRITAGEVRDEVCRQFGIERQDMVSPRRGRALVVPRQMSMALCKRLTKASYPEIGRRHGGRDHTTVIHACNKMAGFIAALPTSDLDSVSVWVTVARERFYSDDWRHLRDYQMPPQNTRKRQHVEELRGAVRAKREAANQALCEASK